MAERYPGGVISKTPPTVTGPAPGTGGAASGVWTLSEVLGYVKAGVWPGAALPFEDRLYAWGFNSNGQLGNNSVISRSSPVQIGALTNWESISSGSEHSAAIKDDGTLWTWGLNNFGQLGNNTAGYYYRKSSPVQIGALTNWSQVSAGQNFTAAIKTTGTLWAWGLNTSGQVGNGTTSRPSSPVQIGALTNWSQVSANIGDHSAAVKTDGTLWAWGDGAAGRLGDGTIVNKSSPVQIGALTDWSQVSGGGNHTVALKTTGTLWAWGQNTSGTLGDNTVVNKSSPVQIGALTNWSQISAGGDFNIAVKTDGTLWTWGGNGSGQLGDNTQGNYARKSSPIQIGALTNWAQVSGKGNSPRAVKTNGTLWAWGANNSGEIGDNTTVNKSSPIQIGSLTKWTKADGQLAMTRG